MSRVDDKIESIVQLIEDLKIVKPMDFESYKNDLGKKLASERAFEKIIESLNDLAILFIKEKRLPLPTDDENAFEILANAKFISEDLSDRMRKAKGMRNILAHQYEFLDDEIIFEAIDTEFLNEIENKK